MLDIGWSELMLIGVVALIVVGPRDLPVMFRTLGRFTAKARAMARDFQRAMDEAAKATGVEETLKDVRDMTSKKSLGLEALENAATKFEQWNPTLPTGKPAAKPAEKAASVTADEAATAEARAATALASTGEGVGAATRALAEKRTAERQALMEGVGKIREKTRAKAAADSAPEPQRKAVRRTKAAPKTPATAETAPPAPETPAPKAPRKPRAKKADA